MKTIKPAKDQIFAKPVDATKTTASGILLPDTAADRPQMAKVINTGDNVTEFKRDDDIIYKLFTTTDIKLNDEEYILIDQRDVLGVALDA